MEKLKVGTLMVLGLILGLVLVLTGCGGESVTGPSEAPVVVGGGTVAQSTDPKPVPTPAATPAPDAAQPYVEFANDGSGKFCNPMTHRGAVTITYTKELDLSEIYGTPKTYYAEPGKCVQIPPAISVLMPDLLPTLKCGETWKKRVQQDANNGEQSLAGKHLGHVFVDVEFAAEACCVEAEETKVETTYGEWGECKSTTNESLVPECLKSRTVTTTKTTTYAACQKKEPLVVVETRTEYEKCECKVQCVPEEKVDVKVTYSEWGECTADKYDTTRDPKCYQSRVKTTTTTTTYAKCQDKEPKVEVKQETEKKECECKVDRCEVSKKREISYCIPLLGNPTEELAFINGLGLGYSFKFSTKYEDVDSPWHAPKDFDAVLLKSGSCDLAATGVKPPQKGTEYRLYLGVDKHDRLEMGSGKDISHASIFTLECER